MRALWILLLLGGCIDELPSEAPQPAQRAAACTALESLTFQSAQPAECGLGPDGPSSCAWHLRFSAADAMHSTFTWSHSDVEESGSVTCNGGVVETTSTALGVRYEGSFDDSRLDLMWDDRAYQLAP